MDFFVHPLCLENCKKDAVSAFCPVLWNASVCILYADGLFLPGMRRNPKSSGIAFRENFRECGGFSDDIFGALDIQDELQTLYTSGTVFHAFLGEKLPGWKESALLVRKIAENYKLPYYTISPTYSICQDHGYIDGEQYTCPHCGKKTEVYSRITGYYRPVQNWNDGKAQEYKNRTLYDVLHSKLKKVHTSMVTVTDDDVKIEPVETHKYLFTTNTCPNCRMAKKMLEGEDLEIIDAEKNPDMARQFGIMQAPTLVITDGEHLKKYVNASNIQKYVDEELD